MVAIRLLMFSVGVDGGELKSMRLAGGVFRSTHGGWPESTT